MKDKLLLTLVAAIAGVAMYTILHFCYASSYPSPQPFLWPAFVSAALFGLLGFGLSFSGKKNVPPAPEEISRVGDVLELEIPTPIKHLGVGVGLFVFVLCLSLYLIDRSGETAGTLLMISILALGFTVFMVVSYFVDFIRHYFLDSEGFSLGGGKIPWTHVRSIATRKIETRKSTRHYINVTLKEDSPFRQTKNLVAKTVDLVKGEGDFRFQVHIYHGIGVDQLEAEMQKRWEMSRETPLPVAGDTNHSGENAE
ncbi:hypothetical protein N9Y42_00035 [Mariniblastus sp.]|nr:hypothetical protein [Mariniblastus sp.]